MTEDGSVRMECWYCGKFLGNTEDMGKRWSRFTCSECNRERDIRAAHWIGILQNTDKIPDSVIWCLAHDHLESRLVGHPNGAEIFHMLVQEGMIYREISGRWCTCLELSQLMLQILKERAMYYKSEKKADRDDFEEG